MNPSLLEKAEALPAQPGVYIFKDESGRPIYVGKAKSLRHRVRSYFQDSRLGDDKRDRMLEMAGDLETILVDNERESLALENNLIKQFKPRYNILLRDDKSYPFIKLTLQERFPRVYVTRRVKKNGSHLLRSIFSGQPGLPYRGFYSPSFPCSLLHGGFDAIPPRPCLQYHIHRCLGPCVENLTTPERYAEAVRDVRMLLEGRESDLVRSLHDAWQRHRRGFALKTPRVTATRSPPLRNFASARRWRPGQAKRQTCWDSTRRVLWWR